MPHDAVLFRLVIAALLAGGYVSALLPTPVLAEETAAAPVVAGNPILQPNTDADRIISWFGYELRAIGSNSLGIFTESGGEMVGTRSCVCSSGDGLCRAVVAETPHYAFCDAQPGTPCAGACTFE